MRHHRFTPGIIAVAAIVAGFAIAWLSAPAPPDRQPPPAADSPNAGTWPSDTREPTGTTAQFDSAPLESDEAVDEQIETAGTHDDAHAPPDMLLADAFRPRGDEAQLYAGARENFEAALHNAGDDPAAVAEQLAARIGGTAGEQAADMFMAYARYREQESGDIDDSVYRSAAQSGDVQMLETRLETRAAMRRQHFTDEVATQLFGEEEQMERYYLEHLRLQHDAELEDEERREREAQLRELLPERYREELAAGEDTGDE